MAIFYRNDTDTSGIEEDTVLARITRKATTLSEAIPADIRNKLAGLRADLQGKTEDYKKARSETRANAGKLKTEIQELGRNTSQEYVREEKTAKLKKDPKFEKLLRHANGFDTIRAGDILRMQVAGENIAKYLLTDEDGEEVDLNGGIEKFKDRKLLINFGANSSFDASIGLGDILPYEVKTVEITTANGKTSIGALGTKDSRPGRKERVGYYDIKNGEYIPIYKGYSIKILNTGNIPENDKATFDKVQQTHIEKVRIDEMTHFVLSKNGNKKISPEETTKILEGEFPDEHDRVHYNAVSEKINSDIARGVHIRDAYKDGMGSRDKFIGKFGWYFRDVIAKDFPDIPAYMLVNLFDKESNPRGAFDPGSSNGSGAYGLGQMQPTAWAEAEKNKNIQYDRNSPYDQIHASASYLESIMNRNQCTLKDALVYYHTGPNIYTRYIQSNDLTALETYKRSNSAIAREMKKDSWEGYMAAARYYYTEEPTLLTELDLSKTGTELATKLGDYVMSTSLPGTGDSSCGEAVGILLNRFGIKDLPQAERNGKNWSQFLTNRGDQFIKIAIKHPDEASPGAVLVYDGSGDLGSAENRRFGHVEIKGSDMRYYHYLRSNESGGSAHKGDKEKDPIKYRELTGFTGYAYYPITKQV